MKLQIFKNENPIKKKEHSTLNGTVDKIQDGELDDGSDQDKDDLAEL